MRIRVRGASLDAEVIAEEFIIPGVDITEHRFGVHHSVIPSPLNSHETLWIHEFTATHQETGYSLAHGDTPEEAIANARYRWQQATPEKIAECIAQSHAENWERVNE